LNTDLRALWALLTTGDIEGFIDVVAQGKLASSGSIEFTTLTQCILPPLLLDWLTAAPTSSAHLLTLWSLIRNGTLLIVENDVLEAINARLDQAWCEINGDDQPMPRKLLIFPPDNVRAKVKVVPKPIAARADPLPMHRIVLHSTFLVGLVQKTDSAGSKKNLCASSQEREFLKAIRQFFPSVRAYPNVPLRNFIDVREMEVLSERQRRYARTAEVDVLLCTEDEDPIAGFELDSSLHDAEAVKERDLRKNELFALAGIPLLRIRAEDTKNVRAEDFFDLLVSDSERLDKLRPRRMRPRRNHDVLIPD
jgi:hypothetical protein